MSNHKKKTNTESGLENITKEQIEIDLEYWFECKVEVDEGSSRSEHKVFKKVKQIIKDFFK